MSTSTRNLLLEDIDYKLQETRLGVWRSYMYPSGQLFQEFTAHARVFGLPLVHYTYGRSPETGRRVIAKGIVAVGRFAVGVLAIGHASMGIIAVGQASLGYLFALGQACAGAVAVGQLAIGVSLAVGQLAIGYVAIGQICFGQYVLAQIGWGRFVWDTRAIAPEARQFFRWLIPN